MWTRELGGWGLLPLGSSCTTGSLTAGGTATFRLDDPDKSDSIRPETDYWIRRAHYRGTDSAWHHVRTGSLTSIDDAYFIVSNTAEGNVSDDHREDISATSFTTGTASSGYTLTEVAVGFISNAAGAQTTVKIRNDDAGEPGDTVVATLTGSLNTASDNYTFTPPAGLVLAASTTYWLVVNEGVTGTRGKSQVSQPTRLNIQTPDWSLGTTRLHRAPGTAAWTTQANRRLAFALKGFEGVLAAAEPLVSNVGQSQGQTTTLAAHDTAGEFTTGSSEFGYTLSNIELGLATNTNPAGVTVKLATGLPSATNVVATLTSPGTLTGGALNKFTAPAGTTLSAGTTYYVVIEGTTGSVSHTIDSAEDSGGATGWSIADHRFSRTRTSTGAWTQTGNITDGVPRMRINGAVKTADAPAKPAVPTVVATSPVSVKVSWEAPSHAGPSGTIDDYDLRWYQGTADPADEADWVVDGETGAWPDPGAETSVDVVGLTANTTYRVQVRAHDGKEGPWSDSASVTTQVAVANPVVLVSNIGQADSATANCNLADLDCAQAFTAGTNSEGYLLESVELDFADVPSGVTVKLWTGLTASFRSVVATLANPATLAAGNNKFTAPAGTRLIKESAYWVSVEGEGGNLSLKTSSNEDAGGQSGWSVSNNRNSKMSSETSWPEPTTNPGPLGVRVNGVVRDTTPPTLESATIANLEGGGPFKSGLALNFNEDLRHEHLAGLSNFTAEADDEALTVVSIVTPTAQQVRRYVLLIEELVSPDAAVTVSYAKPAGIQGIQDMRGNFAANFDDVEVTNNMSPGVSGAAFVSSPGSGGAYGVGGHIDVSLTFNTNVTVDTTSGTPGLKIKFASGATGVEKTAGYHSGSGTKVLVFRYTVAAGDASEGVAVVVDSLALNSGTIKSMSSDADAVLGHPGVDHDAGHGIETVAPTLTAAVVTADGRRLALVYDEDLDAGSVPVSGQFSFEQIAIGGNTPIGGAVFTYSVVGNRVEMTKVSGSLDTSAAFEVTYDYNSSIASHRPIRDLAGNIVDSISAQTLSQLTDPAFSAETASFDVVENHAAAIAVGTVTAADADSDTVSYSLAAGADASSLAVNSSTGAITVASGVTLNHEAQATYSLVVQAADGEDEFGQPDTPAASVSKTGQSHSTDYDFGQLSAGDVRQAQSFTTGSRAWGYTLSEIGVHMYEWNGNLAAVTAGVWSTTATGAPDSLLYTLTNPATAVDGAVNTFTAPAGAVLEPDTTYALVLANSSSSGVGVSATGSKDLDSGASAGWDISDTRWQSEGAVWLSRAWSFRISVAAKGRSQPDDTIAVTVNVTDVDEPLTAKPTGLTVTGQATTSLTLSWTAPDSGTGPAVTDYDVRWFQGSTDPSDAADWVEAGETGGHDHVGPATTTTVMGLTKTTAYRFQVRADNGESGTAKGPWSDSAGASTIDQPGIVLIAEPSMVNEGSSATVTIRAERDTTENSAAVTVQLTLLDTSTATSGTDYTALGTLPTITFDEGDESASTTLSIAATQDQFDEGAGTPGDPYEFIHLGGEATGFDVNSTRIAIVDDDDPSTGIELSVSPAEVREQAASAVSVTVTATLDEGARDDDFEVAVALSGSADTGAATDDDRDYTTPAAVSITIVKGQTSGSAMVSIDPNNDSLYEGDETIIFTPSTSASGFTTLTAATLTITDDETKPTAINLSFAPTEVNEGGSAVNVTSVKATLAGTATLPDNLVVTLDGSLGGTATTGEDDGNDYALGGTGSLPTTVTISAGMSSGTATVSNVSITPAQDEESEGDETITLGGSACLITPAMGAACPAGQTLTVNDAVITVVDDDLPVITLSVERTLPSTTPPSLTAVGEGTLARFRVTASRKASDSANAVTVALAAQDGSTAQSGTGYTTTFGSISLGAGVDSASRNVLITAVEEMFDDGDETIVLGGTATGFAVNTATITIVDNDDPTDSIALSINRFTAFESSASTTVRVTATVNKAVPETDVTIDLELDGTAEGGGVDYTATITAPQTIVIAAGQQSGFKDVAIDPEQDTLHEGHESIVFKDANGTSAGGWAVPVTSPVAPFILRDDDPAPTAINLSFTPSTIDEDHGSAVTVTKVTATLAGNSTLPDDTVVTLDSALGGTAADGTDYALDVSGSKALPTSVTIPKGMSSGEVTTTFTVNPTDNNVSADADKTITLGGSACKTDLVAGSCPTSPTDQRFTVNDAVLTLVDDDLPVISLSTARVGGDNKRINEGTSDTFTVTATRGMGGGTAAVNVPLMVQTPAGDCTDCATRGTDYTTDRTTLRTITIPFGEDTGSATVTITTTGDRLVEGDEKLVLTTAVTGFNVEPAEITIVDDDKVSTSIALTVNTSSLNESANATTVRVTARVNDGAPAAAVTVALALAGTATGGGTDYTATPAMLPTITIDEGQTQGSADISIDPAPDDLDEGDGSTGHPFETIVIADSDGNSAGGLTVPVSTATITINDEDDTPTQIALSFSPLTIDEDGAAAAVTVTATLVGPSTRTGATVVALDSALGGSAMGGPTTDGDRDYTTPSSLPSSVTILAGMKMASATTTFSIDPHDNSDSEPNKTITLGGALTGFTVTDASLTLLDDEDPVIKLTTTRSGGNDTSVDEGSSATFTVKAERNLLVNAEEVTVQLEVGDASTADSGDGKDYTELSDLPSITIPAGAASATASVTVTTLGDRLDDDNETIVLVAEVTDFAVDAATITIIDDDDPSTVITLSLDTAEIDEDGGGVTVRAEAEVDDAAPSSDVSIVLSFAGSADKGTNSDTTRDYTDPGTITVTIAKDATAGAAEFQITPLNDMIDEDTETIIVNAALSTGGLSITPSPASFTINLNDDDTVSDAISLSAMPSEIEEATTAAETTVTITATLGTAVTRTVNTSVSLDSALGGTATGGGTDYALKTGTTLPGTVTIPKGMRSGTATFVITLTNDSLSEGEETITLGGSACQVTPEAGQPCPTNSRFTVSDLSIDLDDDDAPEITLRASRTGDITSVDEGSSATFTVTAERNTADNSDAVTVQLDVEAPDVGCQDCANPGVDYNTLTNLPSITISAGQSSATATVTITTLQDRLDEGDGSAGDPYDRIVLDGAVTGTSTAFSVNEATITIVDDDAPSTEITLRVTSGAVVRENGEPVEVTVVAEVNDAVPEQSVAVLLVLTGTAGNPGDYTVPANLAVLIDRRELSGESSFTVTPVNDIIDEDNERITVGGNATGFTTVHEVHVTIADDDTASTVIDLSAAPARIDEDVETAGAQTQASATPVTVTATLRGRSARGTATTVTLDSALRGTATPGGGDYAHTGLPASVVIPADSLSGSVTGWMITPTLDSDAEGDETILLGGTLAGFAVNDATVTIADNDQPEITLATERVQPRPDADADADASVHTSVGEGSEVRFRVTATRDTSVNSDAVSVELAITGGSAKVGRDYTAPRLTTIRIPRGSASASALVTISSIANRQVDGNRTIQLGGRASGFDVVAAPVTIVDDDEPSESITLSLGRTRLGEGAGSAAMTVLATVDDGAPAGPVTVSVTLGGTGPGFATKGLDYADPGTITVTIGTGQVSGVGKFDLDLTDDSIDEDDETITFSGTAAGFDDDDISPAGLTIADNDTASGVELTAAPSSIGESAGAPVSVTLTATLSGGIARTVPTVVSLDSTLGGTARRTSDYSDASLPPDSVTIPAGSLIGTATMTFMALNDEDAEGDETAIVRGSACRITPEENRSCPSAQRLPVSAATITITDDDVPTVTLAAAPADPAKEGESVKVTVSATRSPGDDTSSRLSVPLAITGGTATAGVDFAAQLRAVTIAAGETSGTATVTITATGTRYDDRLIEGPETILIGVAPARVRAAAPAEIALADNDTASTKLELELSRTEVAETGGPTLVTATATVDNGAPTSDVTVTLALGQPAPGGARGATGGADYTAAGTVTLTIGAGAVSGTASFILNMIDDSIDEGDEVITVSGGTSAGGLSVPVSPDIDITVADDDEGDASDEISLALSPTRIAETGGDTPLTVTATLSGTVARGTATTVTLATGLGGTATGAGSDYTLKTGSSLPTSVTIPAGELSADSTSFVLTMNNDSDDEGDETVTLDGSACQITPGAGEACPDDRSFTVSPAVTFVSDDDALVITLSVAGTVTEGGSSPVKVTATRRAPYGPQVRVPLALRGGTATAGTDYAAASRLPTILIPAGKPSGTATVTVSTRGSADDQIIEPDEQIGIGVARSPDGGPGTPGHTVVPAAITVVDDDSVSQKVTLRARRVGTTLVSVTAQLDGAAPAVPVTVTLSLTGEGTAAVVDPPEAIVIRVGQVSAGTAMIIDPTGPGAGKRVTVSGVATGGLTVPVTSTQFTVSRSAPSSSGGGGFIGGGGGGSGGGDEPDESDEPEESDEPDEELRERARALASEVDDVLLVNAWSPPDIAIAAALAAANPRARVIYTAPAGLANSLGVLLGDLEPRRVILIGGTVALSGRVRDDAAGAAGGASVSRVAGRTRIDTAAAVARRLLGDPERSAQRTLIVANGWSPADSRAAAALAARTPDSAVLYTASDSLPAVTEAVIADYQPARIVVIGGTAAASQSVLEAAAAAAPDAETSRLAGDTRIDTAAEVARRALSGVPAAQRTVIVANGWSPADTGVAAALAALTPNSVVLWTAAGSLPAATEAVIAEHQPTRVIIVGGTAAVPSAVADKITAAAPRTDLERVAGSNRLDTAIRAALR